MEEQTEQIEEKVEEPKEKAVKEITFEEGTTELGRMINEMIWGE